jgi:hypothetical protein
MPYRGHREGVAEIKIPTKDQPITVVTTKISTDRLHVSDPDAYHKNVRTVGI